MAGAFKVAEAYVEIKSKIDESDVEADAKHVADKADSTIKEELAKKKPASINLIDWGKTSDALSGLSDIFSALSKFSALTGVALLLGKIAAGAVAMASSLGLASLSVSALIPLVVGLGGAFGVLTLIWKSSDPDIKALKDSLTAFKTTLEGVAVAAALPGLRAFVSNILTLGPMATEFVRRLAQGIGWLGAEFGMLAKSALFRMGLDKLLDSSATGANHLLAAMAPLVNVIVMLGAAAGPTFVRFAMWIENLIRVWSNWLDVATQTGRIQRLLTESADELAKWGKILWNFFSGLVGILKGAKEPALSFSDSLLRISDSFKKWAWNPETQGKIRELVDFLLHVDVMQFFKMAAAFSAISTALNGFSGLADVMKTVETVGSLGPVGAIVVGVAAALSFLVGGLVAAYFASNKFRDAVNNAFGWIKDNVVPILIEVYHWIAEKFINAVNKAVDEAIPGFQDALKTLQDAWNDNKDDLLDFLEKIKSLAGFIIDVGIPILGKLAGYIVKALAVSIGIAMMAISAWNVAMDVAAIVIKGLAIAVAAVAIGIVLAFKWIWNSAQTAFGWLVENVPKIASAIMNGLGVAFAWIGNAAVVAFGWLQTAAEAVVGALAAAWNWLMDELQPVFDFINAGIVILGNIFAYLWDVSQPIFTALGIAWFLLSWAVQSAIGLAKEALAIFMEELQVLWAVAQWVLSGIGAVFTWLVASVIDPMVGIAQTAFGILMDVLQFLWDIAQNVFSAIAAVFSWLVEQIKTGVGWVANFLNFMMGVFRVLQEVANDVTSAAMSAFSSLWSSIVDTAGSIKDTCESMWNGLRDGVSSAINFAKGLLDGLLNTVLNISHRINDTLSAIGDSIKSRLSNPLGWAHGGVVGAASGGVRSGLHMVGEHGPELIHLPAGSTVRSNPDTERLMGGGGQQGGTLQVAFVGNTSDALATVIMGLVRQGKIQLSVGV